MKLQYKIIMLVQAFVIITGIKFIVQLRSEYIELKKENELLMDAVQVRNKKGLYKYEMLEGFEYPCNNPYSAKVSHLYGEPRKGYSHAGLDVVIPDNLVLASRSGYVVERGIDKYLGKYIKLHHPPFYNTIYGHLSEFKIKMGDYVETHKVIGLQGSTGNAKGKHLHFEIQEYLYSEDDTDVYYCTNPIDKDYYDMKEIKKLKLARK